MRDRETGRAYVRAVTIEHYRDLLLLGSTLGERKAYAGMNVSGLVDDLGARLTIALPKAAGTTEIRDLVVIDDGYLVPALREAFMRTFSRPRSSLEPFAPAFCADVITFVRSRRHTGNPTALDLFQLLFGGIEQPRVSTNVIPFEARTRTQS